MWQLKLPKTQRLAAATSQFRRLKHRPSSSSDLSDSDEYDQTRMNVKVSNESCSYGIRKIKEWLKERDLNYTYRLRRIVDPLVHTGMYIEFPLSMSLSIETHPMVCNSDFAETAIMPTLETIEDPSYTKELESPRLILLEPLGYSEKDFVLRHKEANDVYDHILKFGKLLVRASYTDGIVQLSTRETIDLRPPEQAKSKVLSKVPIIVTSDFGPG